MISQFSLLFEGLTFHALFARVQELETNRSLLRFSTRLPFTVKQKINLRRGEMIGKYTCSNTNY